GLWPRRGSGQSRRTTLEALTPRGHLGGIEAIATEERTAPSITARIGIVLLQDELAFSSGQAQACRRCGCSGHRVLLMPCLKRISEPHLSHSILAHRGWRRSPSGASASAGTR